MVHEGMGIDLVEVSRIKKALERWGERFTHRVFTSEERDYCRRKAFPEQSFAARFAAKEAVLKAIGTGHSGGIKWTDVEVVNDPRGKPGVRLRKKITELLGDKKILLSITHTKDLAMAQAFLVSKSN
jgi:holo-[acyl-carrier protein] synthase